MNPFVFILFIFVVVVEVATAVVFLLTVLFALLLLLFSSSKKHPLIFTFCFVFVCFSTERWDTGMYDSQYKESLTDTTQSTVLKVTKKRSSWWEYMRTGKRKFFHENCTPAKKGMVFVDGGLWSKQPRSKWSLVRGTVSWSFTGENTSCEIYFFPAGSPWFLFFSRCFQCFLFHDFLVRLSCFFVLLSCSVLFNGCLYLLYCFVHVLFLCSFGTIFFPFGRILCPFGRILCLLAGFSVLLSGFFAL